MAYDSAEAHEYYEKYKKKGLKKGRKKGKKKTTSSKIKKQNSARSSTSGLNTRKNNKIKGVKTNDAKLAKAVKATKNNSPILHGSASTAARTVSNEEFAKLKEMSEQIELLKSQIATMSDDKKVALKASLKSAIAKLKQKVKKNG